MVLSLEQVTGQGLARTLEKEGNVILSFQLPTQVNAGVNLLQCVHAEPPSRALDLAYPYNL